MTHVYFVRHSEPNYETHDDRSRELTGNGLADRAFVTRYFLGKPISAVLSSPYRRALHTAQIIGAGLGLEPIVDRRLCEISFGPYEGTNYSEGRFADDNIRCCFQDPPRYVAPEGAESFDAVAARVKDFFDNELAPLAGRFTRVLAVAHGGILRTVLRLAAQIPLEDFWKGTQPNCCSHVVDLTDNHLSLKTRSVVFR